MPHDHQFPRVFISYSRYDGADTAARLRRELEALGISLWQDLTAMQGGQDWWRQIQQATDKAEYLVLVLTPGALASKVCKDEWRYARQVGTYVIPVTDLRVADLDLTQLAGWMRRADIVPLHVPERHAWLLEKLKGPAPPLARVPMMAEPPPPDFVPRPAEFARLKQLLLDTRGEPVAITAALRGAGGYGKTTLARALCADPDIQDAFHDGILWTTLGEQPGPLLGRLQDLIATLKGERPDFSTEEAAASQLAELLADRRILLVLDDLWQAAHARPFLRGGPHGARLITTRNSDTLPANAQEAKVDAMQGREAVALLRGDLPAGEDAALAALAARLGEWPLLLRLVHGALRDRTVRAKAPLADAIAYAGRLLDKRGLTAFDARNPEARSDAVAKTIGLSLDLLTADERARFAELAVFPEDIAVPIRTVELLWSHTAGLDDLDTEALLQRLASLSLLLDLDLTARTIRLHDVIRTWLRGEAGPHLPDLDRALVEAYRRQCPTGWPSGPEHDDGYYFQWFPTHLRSADPDAWRTLLADYAWIDAKLRHAGATSLILDYADAPDPELRLIGDALRLSAHVIGHDPAQLAGQLVGRLRATVEPGSPLLRQPLAPSTGRSSFPAGRRSPLPAVPSSRPSKATAAGSMAVAVTPDGRRAVSGSADKTLKVWDLERGAELATLEGHGGWVRAVAVTPDGRRAVSGSSTRRSRSGTWSGGRCWRPSRPTTPSTPSLASQIGCSSPAMRAEGYICSSWFCPKIGYYKNIILANRSMIL